MYIAYDIRNSVEYAKLVKSKRNGKRIEKKYTNLGRDLDKELISITHFVYNRYGRVLHV